MIKRQDLEDHSDNVSQKDYPKSKRIKKSIEDKIALFFRRQRAQKQDMCIYVDSSEEEIKELHPKPISQTQSLEALPFDEEEERQASSLSFSSASEALSDDLTPLPSQPASNRPYTQEITPIFKAEVHELVQEIDFQLYTTFLARTKIYGSLLVDQIGRILWCDKAAHQILEGSLNNFERMRIHHFLLQSRQQQFLQQMRSIIHYDQNTTLQWIIYSKNSKRRFCRVPFPKKSNSYDIFYRFLKHLTIRVRPISISLPNYRDPCGFCNEDLIQKHETQPCFFLELRYAKQHPNLGNFDIRDDPVIRKFLVNIRAKYSNRQKQPSAGLNSPLLVHRQQMGENPSEVKFKEGEQVSGKMTKTRTTASKQVKLQQGTRENISMSCLEQKDVR